MRYCKICFAPIKREGINSFFVNNSICQKCFNEFEVINHYEKIDGIGTFFIYNYNNFLKKLIYQFKGCFDIELKTVFLERFLLMIKLIYKGYYLVGVPSSNKDNKTRKFNHVIEMFSLLRMPFLNCLIKINDEKQSNKKKKDRNKVKNNISLVDGYKIKNKKILIVDDIYTTGNTLRTCIELVKKCNPRKIRALVLCKNCRNSVNFLDRKGF